MKIIGLTGGIASGKSTVARMLRELGIEVIDADQIAREVVRPGTPALAEIQRRWPQVVGLGGAIDRKALGAIVFSDERQRRELNAIVHPRIQEEVRRRAARFDEGGKPAVVYEAALLVENELDRDMDGLIVVSLPDEMQLARLMSRENIGRDEALARMRSQLPLEEKVKRATFVIDNSGSEEQTRKQVEALLDRFIGGKNT